MFSGSGIKIKVGEAISKGKIVLASPHAAVGYEELSKTDSLVVCREAHEYISFINRYSGYHLSIESYKSIMEIFSSENFMKKISMLIRNMKL